MVVAEPAPPVFYEQIIPCCTDSFTQIIWRYRLSLFPMHISESFRLLLALCQLVGLYKDHRSMFFRGLSWVEIVLRRR